MRSLGRHVVGSTDIASNHRANHGPFMNAASTGLVLKPETNAVCFSISSPIAR